MRGFTPIINAFRDQWSAPRDRVLWAPVFLGAGAALYFGLLREPDFTWSAAALVAATCPVIATRLRAPEWFYPALAFFLVALGFVLAQGRTMMVAAPMLERTINFTRVEGRVQDVSVADDETGGGRKRVVLDHLVIEKLAPEMTPREVRLSSAHIPNDVRPGDRIAVLARLMPPSGPVAPGGFDFRRQAYFERTGASGFTMGRFELVARGEGARGVWFNELRQWISQRISAQIPYPQSAVATALLAGERSNIPDQVNDDLRDSGLYHLLSISGLHVAIVCGVVFFVVRFGLALWPWAALHWPLKKMAAVVALGAGIFYCLLAGMPVPAQRSILMTGLVLLAVMLDRTALSMRTIALAAFFTLALKPESVVGASFQLSFAAVLAMIAFYESRARDEAVDRSWMARILRYVGGIVLTTVLVSFATLPPVLHHFGRLQFMGVIANAAAIPLTSFVVMPAGMAALLAMPFHLEAPFLWAVDWGVKATLAVAHFVAGLPYSSVALPSLDIGWYLVSCLGFLWLCLWRGALRWLGVPVMVVACVAGLLTPRPDVMIDAEGRSIGVHANGETAYLLKAPTRFVHNNWVSLWGGREVSAKDLKPPAWGDVALCDDFACRITVDGARVSVLRQATALREECDWAEIVVALDKGAHGCPTKLIRYWELRAAGGLALYGARIVTMTPRDMRRPWTLTGKRPAYE